MVDRQKTTAKKRRRNQNVEIDELAKLLPIKPLPISAPMVMGGASDGNGQEQQKSAVVPSSSSLLSAAAAKNQTVDKISVLRITSTFLKFQEFMKKGYFSEC